METKSSKNKIYVALAIILMLVVGIVCAVSPFARSQHHEIAQIPFDVLFALAVPGVFIVGYVYGKQKNARLDVLTLTILGVVAMLVLGSLIGTWIYYGPFHTVIYKDTPYMYYEGGRYDITKEVMFLTFNGFKEVSVKYATSFALLSASAFPGMFFFTKENDKKHIKRVFAAIIGSIGLLFLINVCEYKALAIFAIFTGIAILYRFVGKSKGFKVLKWLIFVLLLLAVVFYGVAFINVACQKPLTGILDKIFVTNGIMANPTEIMGGVVTMEGDAFPHIIGFNFESQNNILVASLAELNSGIFEVELLKEIGLGALAFLLMLPISYLSMDLELQNGSKNDFEKMTLIILLGSLFTYISLYYDTFPQTHDLTQYSPVLRFIPLLVGLFFLGTALNSNRKEAKGEKNE